MFIIFFLVIIFGLICFYFSSSLRYKCKSFILNFIFLVLPFKTVSILLHSILASSPQILTCFGFIIILYKIFSDVYYDFLFNPSEICYLISKYFGYYYIHLVDFEITFWSEDVAKFLSLELTEAC